MNRICFCMAIVFLLLSAMADDALCAYYKYVDDKGGVHLTDSLQSVPAKYRPSAKMMSVDSSTDGVTPTLDAALNSESFATDSWFDYSEMPFYERWFLLARAGCVDIMPILKEMGGWIGVAIMTLGLLYFYIFKIFDSSIKRGGLVMILLSVVVFGLFYKYVRTVEGNSKALLCKVRELRDMSADRQKRILGVLESVSDDSQ